MLSVFFVLTAFLFATPTFGRVHEIDDAPPPTRPPSMGAGRTPPPPLSQRDVDANKYLERYGYISPRYLEGRQAPGAAIRRFQSFAGIPVTGILDADTVEMMEKPRCGVKDWNPEEAIFDDDNFVFDRERRSTRRRSGRNHVTRRGTRRRFRRYVTHGTKWRKNDLTYRIDRYTSDLPRAVVESTIAKALNFWGEKSKLTFTRKEANEGSVDIRILFQSGRHGDEEAFDGRGGVLAHAYFPFDNRRPLWGDAHFDDAETWTVRSYRGQNLLYVAVHEFGHSLGLMHSKVRGAIMWPWAGSYIPGLKLTNDDIRGIQALYGEPVDGTTAPTATPTAGATNEPTPPPTPPTPPGDDCTGRVDAIEVAVDGNVYAFKLAHVYQLNEDGFEDGFPKLIKEVFPDGPSYVDAAVTVQQWDTTYLFKGNQYWRYSMKNGRLYKHSDYPRFITKWGFPSTTVNLDAAFQWGPNNSVFFFKGNRFWTFNVGRRRLVRTGFLTSGWRGLPPYGVTAAMRYTNERTYFFGRNGTYFRWNDEDDVIDVANPPYPRSTSEWWFGCQN